MDGRNIRGNHVRNFYTFRVQTRIRLSMKEENLTINNSSVVQGNKSWQLKFHPMSIILDLSNNKETPDQHILTIIDDEVSLNY